MAKRLTEKITDKRTGEVLAYQVKRGIKNLKAIQKLGEYETAEEEGRLVTLPCNVGTEVFIIFEYANCGERFLSTKEHVVTDILLNRNRSPLFRITNLFGTMKLEDFGKTVFFTREEAEKALEEANKIE